MSSYEDPEEGPVTSEHFLEKNTARPTASAVVAKVPTITNVNLTGVDLNEQGLLTPWQRSMLIRQGILWQIPLVLIASFGVPLGLGYKRIGFESIISFILGALAISLIALIPNAWLLIDLRRGKVYRTEGYLTTRTEGSVWLRNKHTVSTIGSLDIRPATFWWNFLFGPAFADNKKYVVYYLPVSKIVVAHYSEKTFKTLQPNQVKPIRPLHKVWFYIGVLVAAVCAGATALLVAIFITAFTANHPFNSQNPVYNNGYSSTPNPTRIPTTISVSAGFMRTLSGHKQSVSSVVFTPDGKTILTGSWDDSAILWDTATGQQLRTFLTNASLVNCVAFSPDGKTVLTGSWDGLAILWNTTSGEKLRTFSGHTNAILSLAFSPDGKTIVTGSQDNTAIIWDAISGEKLHVLSGHKNPVKSVAFSPDGTEIVTGSGDATAILWDTASGAKLRTFDAHLSIVSSMAFSPDGKTILTGSWDKTAIAWDALTGKQIQTFSGHNSAVNAVAFAPNGKTMLTGSSDMTAILWDVASGKQLRTFSGHSAAVNSVVFSPDGKTVLTGSDDHTAKLWDISDLVDAALTATP